MSEPKIEDFGENLKWKIDHFPPYMEVRKRGEAVYSILQMGSFLLRSATPLHVQSIIEMSPTAQLKI